MIGRDETAAVVREAGYCGAHELRQRDDRVRLDCRPARHFEQAVVPGNRRHSGAELDATDLEQLCHRLARRRAEETEGPLFRSHEKNIHASSDVVGDVLCREERELVQRKRPSGRGRYRKSNAVKVARGCPLEECRQSRPILRAAERQGTDHSLSWSSTHGEDECVKGKCFATLEQRDLLVRVDAGDNSMEERCTCRRHQPGKRKPPHLADAEWLRYGQRAVDEFLLRGDELDRDQVVRQRPQRQSGFESRNTSTCDHNTKRHRASHHGFSLAAILVHVRGSHIGAITDRAARVTAQPIRRAKGCQLGAKCQSSGSFVSRSTLSPSTLVM